MIVLLQYGDRLMYARSCRITFSLPKPLLMLGLKRLLKVLKGVDIDVEVPPARRSEEGLGEAKALDHNGVTSYRS